MYNILFFIIAIIDARYNYFIIQGASPNDVINNRKWHKWGGTLAFAIATFIGIYVNPYVGALYLCYRASIFPIALNLFRGKSLFYLSNAGFEGWFVRKNLQWVYYLGGFFFVFLFNYLKSH